MNNMRRTLRDLQEMARGLASKSVYDLLKQLELKGAVRGQSETAEKALCWCWINRSIRENKIVQ